jgi:excisionase family DNA binding protein
MNESDRRIRPEVQQQYFTQREVAEIVGVTERTVRKWIKSGHLPTHKIGRRDKVFIDDLERAIRNQQLSDEDQ